MEKFFYIFIFGGILSVLFLYIGLIRSSIRVYREEGDVDWTNIPLFLTFASFMLSWVLVPINLCYAFGIMEWTEK